MTTQDERLLELVAETKFLAENELVPEKHDMTLEDATLMIRNLLGDYNVAKHNMVITKLKLKELAHHFKEDGLDKALETQAEW